MSKDFEGQQPFVPLLQEQEFANDAFKAKQAVYI